MILYLDSTIFIVNASLWDKKPRNVNIMDTWDSTIVNPHDLEVIVEERHVLYHAPSTVLQLKHNWIEISVCFILTACILVVTWIAQSETVRILDVINLNNKLVKNSVMKYLK